MKNIRYKMWKTFSKIHLYIKYHKMKPELDERCKVMRSLAAGLHFASPIAILHPRRQENDDISN